MAGTGGADDVVLSQGIGKTAGGVTDVTGRWTASIPQASQYKYGWI